MSQLRIALPLLALAFAVSGCAAMRAASAKQQYVNSQAESYAYEKPLEEVWPNVRQLLFAKGYQVKDAGQDLGAYTLETEQKYESTANGSFTRRYLVQGIKTPDGKAKVHFTAQTSRYGSGSSTPSTSSARDHAIEFELIRMVEPSKASEIESEGERQGQIAANSN